MAVSQELRDIETEIDSAYKSNILINCQFASAAWYFLAFGEEVMFKSFAKHEAKSAHDSAMVADNLVFRLQYPLLWIYKSCRAGGKIPFKYDGDYYQAAWDLYNLGDNYLPFVAAFTYASRDISRLEIRGNEIIVHHTFLDDTRYEAYNRFMNASIDIIPPLLIDPFDAAAKTLKINHDRFSYRLNHKIVDLVKPNVEAMLNPMFTLPGNWEFTRYSLQNFRDFFTAVVSMTYIHWCARYVAAMNGCVGIGYSDSILILDKMELLYRISRYSGLSQKTISEIVMDLTYGSKEIRIPDPALQPIISLNHQKYALMPWLWMSLSAERNLTVLLNKLPSEKESYARLVNQKEDIMRQNFTEALQNLPFRYKYGKLPLDSGLPDIDFAIISDDEKACLLIEFKWFIDPAEINEVIEKSDELRKGVTQLKLLKHCFEEKYQPILKLLSIDETYTLNLAVVSANWIGHSDTQDADVPILHAKYFVKKLTSAPNLLSLIKWISDRDYLPTEGVHYKIVDDIAEISNWSLKWYGIKPLISDEFSP